MTRSARVINTGDVLSRTCAAVTTNSELMSTHDTGLPVAFTELATPSDHDSTLDSTPTPLNAIDPWTQPTTLMYGYLWTRLPVVVVGVGVVNEEGRFALTYYTDEECDLRNTTRSPRGGTAGTAAACLLDQRRRGQLDDHPAHSGPRHGLTGTAIAV